MRRIVLATLLVALGSPLTAQDKAADVVAEMRTALGGGALDTLRTLSLEGTFRRVGGPREMTGTSALTIELPNRMYRSEEIELPGGASVERITVLNGDTAWEDVKRRGAMGGGIQIMTRGPQGAELNPQAIEEVRLRRHRAEMMRYLLMFAGASGLQPTYVAVAESPDGKADVIEVKNETGASARLFVDQQTHLPLMMQFKEVRPRMMFQGPGPGGRGGRGRGGRAPGPQPGERIDPEEMRRRLEQMPPPAPSDVTMYFADYKEVGGVQIPHRITQSVDGKPVEEWTIEKVKVNPELAADFFEKK
jgi:hypothetical protein